MNGTVVAVDLAAKYSAICQLADDLTIQNQTDSWGITESAFINRVVDPWNDGPAPAKPPILLAVEDLPHRLPFSALVKRVARIQGRIVDRMDQLYAAGTVLFVPPALWRKAYAGLRRGTGPDAVVGVAAALGYTPPDLGERINRAGDRAIARKVATDYCAAYLIARWAVTTFTTAGTFDVPGTSRYR